MCSTRGAPQWNQWCGGEGGTEAVGTYNDARFAIQFTQLFINQLAHVFALMLLLLFLLICSLLLLLFICSFSFSCVLLCVHSRHTALFTCMNDIIVRRLMIFNDPSTRCSCCFCSCIYCCCNCCCLHIDNYKGINAV